MAIKDVNSEFLTAHSLLKRILKHRSKSKKKKKGATNPQISMATDQAKAFVFSLHGVCEW